MHAPEVVTGYRNQRASPTPLIRQPLAKRKPLNMALEENQDRIQLELSATTLLRLFQSSSLTAAELHSLNRTSKARIKRLLLQCL